MTTAPLAVDVTDLIVRRGTTNIIHNLSCCIEAGQCVAVLGPNGCGKTTLARVIVGQVFPTAGRVSVLGLTLGRCDIRELRRRVGLVNPTTDPGPAAHAVGGTVDASLSATNAVVTGFFATVGLYDRPTDMQREHARTLLHTVGLGHRLDTRFALMSTGEQRRALIARALVHIPELLILDEPTAGLDLAAREQVLATLAHLRRLPNAPAVLLITHHTEELPPDTDTVYLMKQGRFIAQGEPALVMTNERLTRTFGCPVRVRREGGRWWSRSEAGGWGF